MSKGLLPLFIYCFIAVELIVIGYLDFKYKKIKNFWSLFNIFLFVVFTFIFSEYYSFHWKTFVWPLGFLFVGFGLFVLKIMGGGDSKFLFSFFLIIPEKIHDIFFLNLIYATFVVGLLMLIFNTVKNFDKLKVAYVYKNLSYVKDVYGTKFAYAPIIALSWILLGWDILDELVY